MSPQNGGIFLVYWSVGLPPRRKQMVRRHRVGVRYPCQMPLKPPTPNQETPSSTHSTLSSFFRKNCLQSQPTEILKKLHNFNSTDFCFNHWYSKKRLLPLASVWYAMTHSWYWMNDDVAFRCLSFEPTRKSLSASPETELEDSSCHQKLLEFLAANDN